MCTTLSAQTLETQHNASSPLGEGDVGRDHHFRLLPLDLHVVTEVVGLPVHLDLVLEELLLQRRRRGGGRE